ncbi:hypothetical protein ABTE71_19820, partial [Acinetobacter baumannii]
ETLNETLPDELEEVLDNMQTIRKSLNGDFTDKVNKLNDITKVLAAKQEILPADKQDKTIKWQEVVKFILFAFAFMIIGHTLFSYIPF